jgi:hypothetical protein
VVHEEPRMVAVPQFLSPEEFLGLGWPGDVQEFMVKKPVKHGESHGFHHFNYGLNHENSMKYGDWSDLNAKYGEVHQSKWGFGRFWKVLTIEK